MRRLQRNHPHGFIPTLKSMFLQEVTRWRVIKRGGRWYIQRRWVFSPFYTHTLEKGYKLVFIDLTWASNLPLFYSFAEKETAISYLKTYLENPALRINGNKEEQESIRVE